jgi:hypothetical protein
MQRSLRERTEQVLGEREIEQVLTLAGGTKGGQGSRKEAVELVRGRRGQLLGPRREYDFVRHMTMERKETPEDQAWHQGRERRRGATGTVEQR